MDTLETLLRCEAQNGMSIIDAEALLALTRHASTFGRMVANSTAPIDGSMKLIIVTVPHAACQVMGVNEELLNSADVWTLAAIQHQLDSGFPAGPRMCDRRALVAAIGMRVAFLRLSPPGVGMVVAVNQNEVRADCDANRESCHGTLRKRVADIIFSKSGAVVWNIDAHSFPAEHTHENIYMLARVHPEPFASRKRALLRNVPISVYAGSEENYFMKWFEDTKRVPSLLVEFCESAQRYPIQMLNYDAHVVVDFVLRNIDLYKTLEGTL